MIAFLLVFIYMALIIPAYANAEELQQSETLSIQQAIERAQENNPALRLAELETEKAQINRDDAADAVNWLPSEGVVTTAFDLVVNSWQQSEIGLTTAKRAEEAKKDEIAKDVISAYAAAVKNYNNLKSVELTLKNTKDQQLVRNIALNTGWMSSFDYDSSWNGTKQVEEGYRAAELAYEGSIADLRSLLGESAGWTPVLTSEAIITEHPRKDLNIEIVSASSESVLVWTMEALLDIEKSKENWYIKGVSSEMKQINLDTAKLNYEDAKTTARTMVEQMYYAIDTLEGQIDMAELKYNEAMRQEELARLKYELGMIPRISMVPGADNLESAVLAASQAKIDLENMKLELVGLKAQYALLTGAEVYSWTDWIQ